MRTKDWMRTTSLFVDGSGEKRHHLKISTIHLEISTNRTYLEISANELQIYPTEL